MRASASFFVLFVVALAGGRIVEDPGPLDAARSGQFDDDLRASLEPPSP